jgi:hypothetical protein
VLWFVVLYSFKARLISHSSIASPLFMNWIDMIVRTVLKAACWYVAS